MTSQQCGKCEKAEGIGIICWCEIDKHRQQVAEDILAKFLAERRMRKT